MVWDDRTTGASGTAGQEQQAPAEPTPAEPTPAELTAAELTAAEPTAAEPTAAEPKPAERANRAPLGPRPGRRRARRVVAVVVVVIALGGLAVAAGGVAVALLPRRFTATQQHQIRAWQVSARWRDWPAARIFPEEVGYRLPADALYSARNLTLRARRLAIARQSTCAAAASPATLRVLDRGGCRAVLRATYEDSTSSLVATIGIAVLASKAATASAARALGAASNGTTSFLIRPFAVPGTSAEDFSSAYRQLSWDSPAGPYLILLTVGYASGRPRLPVALDSYQLAEMSALADGIARTVGHALGAAPPTPRCPGAPGC